MSTEKKKILGEAFTCPDCGRAVVRKGMRQTRCAECQAAHVKELREKKKAARPPEESILICADCGRSVPRTGWRQVRCEDCKTERRKKKSEEYRRASAERAAARRKIEDEKPGHALARINEEARKLGLSYGRYVGLVGCGGIEAYRKNRKTGAAV